MGKPARPLPELLAPAGSPEALSAALSAGADAVYLGGSMLNARMNAQNFGDAEIVAAVADCHRRGVRLYVTVNTLVFDRELREVLRYAARLYEAGVDALIVADLGFASLLRRTLPELDLHASTQFTGQNAEAARFFERLGFTRMVSPRELSRTDLALLCKHSPIEIEHFVHGALCACHSGQCLMSSVIGGRSGNRGACAQPCRMAYGSDHPISLKDLCLAGHLSELCEMGVASLKLEGRMKSPDYVYGVTRIYRRLLDEGRNAGEREMAELGRIFSRGGFTDGYYTARIGKEMLGIRSQADKQASQAFHGRSWQESKRALPPIVTPSRTSSYTSPECCAEALPRPKAGRLPKPSCTARFQNAEQIPKIHPFEVVALPLSEWNKGAPKGANGVILPPVVTDSTLPELQSALTKAMTLGARHFWVGTLGALPPLRRAAETAGIAPILHGDFRLNVCNSLSAEQLFAEGFSDLLLSPELTLPKMRDIGGEKAAIVYGRLPLMLLEKPIGRTALRDRTGATFPVLREGGRDLLLNSVPLYMADRDEKLTAAGIRNRHFLFTTETKAEVAAVISAYQRKAAPSFPVKRIGS